MSYLRSCNNLNEFFVYLFILFGHYYFSWFEFVITVFGIVTVFEIVNDHYY